MEISYFRSSSLNNWEYCQIQYYMTYILGKTVSTNLKTEKGTVVHKVLEILAGLKLAHQNTGKYEYEDENIGKVKCKEDNFLKLEILSDEEVEAVNKSMINKDTYLDQPRIKYGHKRYGIKIVEEIIKRSFDYYKDKSDHTWGKTDFKDCTNFTWLALDHNDGDFDPRKRTIVSPEQSFNFIIEEDWAKLPDGGYLGLKGTIDLTTEIDDETIEIIDWKTGQRKNWATGEIKSFEHLQKDKQLMLYYYAAKKAFPKYKHVMITIFFVRHGGPFTVCFDDDKIVEIKEHLAKTKLEIENCSDPKLLDPSHKDFRCKFLCTYFKNKVGKSCYCDYIKDEIKVYGLEQTTKKHREDGFSIGFYQNPGE